MIIGGTPSIIVLAVQGRSLSQQLTPSSKAKPTSSSPGGVRDERSSLVDRFAWNANRGGVTVSRPRHCWMWRPSPRPVSHSMRADPPPQGAGEERARPYLHQPALRHRRLNERRKQRVRLERTRLQFGMELHADEPRMILIFDDL